MKIVVGITGASGAVYGLRLIEVLKKAGCEVAAVVTESGWKVLDYECACTPELLRQRVDRLYDIKQIEAAVASGSYRNDAMVIMPCSMKTLACIANGITDNLLTRAADVSLKEGRRLIIVPRETPLNAVHLENMLKLARLGTFIVPAAPAFYHRPQQISDLVDMLVGKVCDLLGLETELFRRWSD